MSESLLTLAFPLALALAAISNAIGFGLASSKSMAHQDGVAQARGLAACGRLVRPENVELRGGGTGTGPLASGNGNPAVGA